MKSNRLPVSGNFLVVIAAMTVLSASAYAQTRTVGWAKSPIGPEKVTTRMHVFRQIEGVEIEDVIVEGRSISMNEPFAAGDDWIKSLTFRVRNTSSQSAFRIQISMVLPEIGISSPNVVYCYGCDPVEKAKGVMPGEVVELKMLGGGFYEWVLERAAENGLTRINKAGIHHMYVSFPTGPTWFSGCIKTTNPKNACPLEP